MNRATRMRNNDGFGLCLAWWRDSFRGAVVTGCIMGTAAAWASSVTVNIGTLDPEPAWINADVTALATATFTADGREQDQATAGWTPEYRWKWLFPANGVGTSFTPSFNPADPPWTEWAEGNVGRSLFHYPRPGAKTVTVTVQARLRSGSQTSAVKETQTTAGLTVLDLEDASHVRVVAMDFGQLTLRWAPSMNPNVVGYKYHIEPDRDTLYDVGNVTQTTITGLTNGQTYTIHIHAYDANGNMTRSPSVTSPVPIDTDGDGWWDFVEVLLGTEPDDRGSAPAGELYEFEERYWTDYLGAANKDCLWWAPDGSVPEFSVGPTVPDDFIYDLDLTASGGVRPSMWAWPWLRAGRTGTPPLPEQMDVRCSLGAAWIRGNIASGSGSFNFPEDETESERNGFIVATDTAATVWLDITGTTGPDWVKPADALPGSVITWQPPGAFTVGTSEEGMTALSFSVRPLKTDIDMRISGWPQGPRPPYQEAPAYIGVPAPTTVGLVTLALDGRLPSVERVITLHCSDAGTAIFQDPDCGGTVVDGNFVIWCTTSSEVTVQMRPGPTPAGGAVIGAEVDSITDIDDPRAADLLVDFFPGESVFVPVQGSSETTEIMSVNLRIWNGGGDLGNGEGSPHAQGDEVVGDDDADGIPNKQQIGAYLLVNWDNDDGTGVLNADGTWTVPPTPDLLNNYVPNEDNLASLMMDVISDLSPAGIMELEVGGVDASKVSLWRHTYKLSPITLTSGKKTWDLANSAQRADFISLGKIWVEGHEKGSTERGVSFYLRYKSGGTVIAEDYATATVVMLNLGIGLYREMKRHTFSSRGHTGLLTSYKGKCVRDELRDSSKYNVTEMEYEKNRCVITSWRDFYHKVYGDPITANWGPHGRVLDYVSRLKILGAADLVRNNQAIHYIFDHVLEPDPWTTGQLCQISGLRCDGLVEVCYEFYGLGLDAWGKRSGGTVNYSIKTNLPEHNDSAFLSVPWEYHLFPATQCGKETTGKGTVWDTTFVELLAIEPPLGSMIW